MDQDAFQETLKVINQVFENAKSGTLPEPDYLAVHAQLLQAGNQPLADELTKLWQANRSTQPPKPANAQQDEAIHFMVRVFQQARNGTLSDHDFNYLHQRLLDANNPVLANDLTTTWRTGRQSQHTNSLSTQQLQHITDPIAARALFQQSIRRIYIEVSSYCNRRCPYCPNSRIDRTTTKFLPMAVLEKIFSELQQINYNAGLFFNCYNEPLADPNLCDKIALFKHYCPQATALLYSNGDYLNRHYLEQLHQAGLAYLNISLHTNSGLWNDEEVMNRLNALAKRLDMTPKIELFASGSHLLAFFPESKITIKVQHSNFLTEGSNRGHLMEQIKTETITDKPCIMPFNDLYIAWDGSILPCCHLHADAPEHQGFKIGTIQEFPDIFAAYANSPLVEWRQATCAPTKRRPPCDSCIERVENSEIVEKMREISQQAKSGLF